MIALEDGDEKEIINKPTFNPHVYLGKGRGKSVGCPPPLQSRANAFSLSLLLWLRDPELGELGEGLGLAGVQCRKQRRGQGANSGCTG